MATLLITRPEAAARRFLLAVEAEMGPCVRAVLSPVMRIVPVPGLSVPVCDALVLTSEHGVSAARALGVPAGTRCYCVGDQTAQTARAAGYDAISAGGDAETLLALLAKERPGGRLLHLRGEHARGAVVSRLRSMGLEAQEVIAYRQEPLPLTGAARKLLAGNDPVVLPLFSPRSASIFVEAVDIRAPLHIVAMSRAVAAEVADLGADTVMVADRPDGPAMIAATCRRLDAVN